MALLTVQKDGLATQCIMVQVVTVTLLPVQITVKTVINRVRVRVWEPPEATDAAGEAVLGTDLFVGANRKRV